MPDSFTNQICFLIVSHLGQILQLKFTAFDKVIFCFVFGKSIFLNCLE